MVFAVGPLPLEHADTNAPRGHVAERARWLHTDDVVGVGSAIGTKWIASFDKPIDLGNDHRFAVGLACAGRQLLLCSHDLPKVIDAGMGGTGLPHGDDRWPHEYEGERDVQREDCNNKEWPSDLHIFLQ